MPEGEISVYGNVHFGVAWPSGGGGAAGIDIVKPDENALELQAADAKFTYEALSGKASVADLPSVPVKAVKRNGTALTPDAQGAVDVAVPTVDNTLSAQGAAADAKATGDALSGKASVADATLTPIYEGGHTEPFSEWSFDKPATVVIGGFHFNASSGKWSIEFGDQQDPFSYDGEVSGTLNDTEVVFDYSEGIGVVITATRTAYALTSYRLGNDAAHGGLNADKPIPAPAAIPAVVAPSTSATTGQAADAKATGDELAGKLGRSEAEKGFTEWEFEPSIPPNTEMVYEEVVSGSGWRLSSIDPTSSPLITGSIYKGDQESTSISWGSDDYAFVDGEDDTPATYAFTATRTRLRPTAEMEASWNEKASVADATLVPVYSDTPTYSEWTSSDSLSHTIRWNGSLWEVVGEGGFDPPECYDFDATSISSQDLGFTATRTRTDIIGYQLGSQTEKPLAALETLQFKEWFPGGEAKSISDCTSGLKFDWANQDNVNHTVKVLPFCNTGTAANDNSDKAGLVVIPPYVDHKGVRYVVVGVYGGEAASDYNQNLTNIIAPSTVTTIGQYAFQSCTSLTSVSLPEAKSIGGDAFDSCTSLSSISLPAATAIDIRAFAYCEALVSVNFGSTARQSVPTLGIDAFPDLSQSGHTCRIIVPDADYAAWTTNSDWATLTSMGYVFVRHSETEPAERGDIELSANYSDTPKWSDEWTISVSPAGALDGHSLSVIRPDKTVNPGYPDWQLYIDDIAQRPQGTEDSSLLSWSGDDYFSEEFDHITGLIVTAIRQRIDVDSYRMGPNDASNPNKDKLLASKESTEVHLPEGPTDGYTEWVVSPSSDESGNPVWPVWDSVGNGWGIFSNGIEDLWTGDRTGSSDSVLLKFTGTDSGNFIATRRPKYVTIGNNDYALVTKEWMDNIEGRVPSVADLKEKLLTDWELVEGEQYVDEPWSLEYVTDRKGNSYWVCHDSGGDNFMVGNVGDRYATEVSGIDSNGQGPITFRRQTAAQSLFDKSAAGTATLAELNEMVTALYMAFGFSVTHGA